MIVKNFLNKPCTTIFGNRHIQNVTSITIEKTAILTESCLSVKGIGLVSNTGFGL
jgi:hypothetical protein